MEKVNTSRVFLYAVILLLLTAFNLSSLKAQYQPFGEEGSEWYIMQKEWPFPGAMWIYYLKPFRISNVGETVIKDKVCQMLYVENIGYFTHPSLVAYHSNDTIYIHNDSGRIYYFDVLADRFKLGIDFNADVGDSWVAELPCEDSTLIWYNPEIFQDTFDFVVQNVSYLETDGPSLKILNTNRHNFIERVGWPGMLLPYYEDLCQHLDHNDPLFVCSYYDPEVGLIKFQDYDCENKITVTSVGSAHELPISILPNPAFDEIFVQLPEHFSASQSPTIKIYNQLGQRVLHQKLGSQSVSISHLQAGMYFVQLHHQEFVFMAQKLVVY